MERTKQVIRKRNLFLILSIIVWLGSTLFCVLSVFSKLATTEEDPESNPASEVVANEEQEESDELLTDSAKALLFSLSTTVIIGIVASILIKDKLRTAIWMADVVISAIVYNSTGMYVILILWFIEEYVLHNLYLYYKSKVSINKELDLRERAA